MSAVTTVGPTFESAAPTALFETRMSALMNFGYTRNQYVVSADGQRFLINQPPADAIPAPITIVEHWMATLKP